MSKVCIHCGAPLHEQASFCHACAASQIEKHSPALPAPRWKHRVSVAGAILTVALLVVLAGRVSVAGTSAEAADKDLTQEQSGVVSPLPDDARGLADGSTTEIRRLSDERLVQLKDADAQTLQREIGTVADAVAYLDQFDGTFYDAVDEDFRMDIWGMLELHRSEATGCDFYTAFTGWCLADDHPDGGYLLACGEAPGFLWIYHGLLLPVEAGYRVISPAAYSTRWNCVWGFDEVMVGSREELAGQLALRHDGMSDDSGLKLYDLFAVKLGLSRMDFWLDGARLQNDVEAEELFRAES